MLTYRRLDKLEIIGYSDSDFARFYDESMSFGSVSISDHYQV